MIVHEWAHLRWGVFDEYHQYGLDDDGRAGRCTQQVAKNNRADDKIMNARCFFF